MLTQGTKVQLVNGSQPILEGVVVSLDSPYTALINSTDGWWVAKCEQCIDGRWHSASFYRTEVDYVISINGQFIDVYGELVDDKDELMKFDNVRNALDYITGCPLDLVTEVAEVKVQAIARY